MQPVGSPLQAFHTRSRALDGQTRQVCVCFGAKRPSIAARMPTLGGEHDGKGETSFVRPGRRAVPQSTHDREADMPPVPAHPPHDISALAKFAERRAVLAREVHRALETRETTNESRPGGCEHRLRFQ